LYEQNLLTNDGGQEEIRERFYSILAFLKRENAEVTEEICLEIFQNKALVGEEMVQYFLPITQPSRALKRRHDLSNSPVRKKAHNNFTGVSTEPDGNCAYN